MFARVASAAEVEIGRPQYGKGVWRDADGAGLNCGHRVVTANDWTFGKPTGRCTRFIMCEETNHCEEANIDSPLACAKVAASNKGCAQAGGVIEARNYGGRGISHCFCHAADTGRKWVPDTSHAQSTAYTFELVSTTKTTETATTTTMTTTTTATSTTNTIIQNLQGQLTGVNAKIEEQVVKTEAHVTRLEAKVTSQLGELAVQAAEMNKQRQQLADQSTRMQELETLVASMQAAFGKLAAKPDVAPPGSPPRDGPCRDDLGGGSNANAGGGSPSIESVGTDGMSLDIAACNGDLLIHTKECSVDPCAVQQMVSILQNKLQSITLD